MDPISSLGPIVGKYFFSRFQDETFGSPQWRALNEVSDEAVVQTLQHLEIDPADPLDETLKATLRGGGLRFLLESYESGTEADYFEFLQMFIANGGDEDTASKDFRQVSVTLSEVFVETLERDAQRPGSALSGFVIINQLKELLRPRKISLESLKTACREITQIVAKELVPDPLLVRYAIRNEIDAFLNSDVQWCGLVGSSGTGKSALIGSEALRLQEEDWIVLLQRGWFFSLEHAADSLMRRIPGAKGNTDWHSLLFEPWSNLRLNAKHSRFLLLVDGIDECDQQQLRKSLTFVSDSLASISADRWKVIFSTGEIRWPALSQYIPVGKSGLASEAPGLKTIEVTDFDERELDEGLRLVGAEEFLPTLGLGGRPDSYVESVRDLIRHPATFEIFATILPATDSDDQEFVVSTAIVDKYIQKRLNEVQERCGHSIDFLQDAILSLSALAMELRRPDASIDVAQVRRRLPELKVEKVNPSESPMAALIERGIIERRIVGDKVAISFKHQDVASSALASWMELQTSDCTIDLLAEYLSVWLNQAFEYPLIVDALVAWTSRLCRNAKDPKLVQIVESILASHSVRLEVVFRLMPPTVAQTILDAVYVGNHDFVGNHQRALLSLRWSTALLSIIRNHIQSAHKEVQLLAVRAAGFYRDNESVDQLAALLERDDDELRRRATRELGWIGAPALPRLLNSIQDELKSEVSRTRHVHAIRAIGYRSGAVESTLTQVVLSELLRVSNSDLLRSALLAAAAIRSREVAEKAIQGLASDDWRTVLDTAKLLTEVPTVKARQTLLDALNKWSEIDLVEKSICDMVCRQIVAAFSKLATESEELLEIIRKAFSGESRLSPAWAIKTAELIDRPDLITMVLDDLVQVLKRRPVLNRVTFNFGALSDVWAIDQLDALQSATANHLANGDDLAELVIDALIDLESADDSHPLRRHHFATQALHAMVVCQSGDLAIKLAKLIHSREEFPIDEVYRVLRSLASSKVEVDLTAKLDQLAGEERNDRSCKRILWTLITCGTASARTAIVRYLESAPIGTIQPGFSDQILVPLIKRGILDAQTLSEITSNSLASEDGRLASMAALGTVEPDLHQNLFITALQMNPNPRFRGFAAIALGRVKTPDAALALLSALNDQDHWVRSVAAISVAEHGLEGAIPKIESMLDESALEWYSRNYIQALGLLKQPSSLKKMSELLELVHDPSLRSELIEAIGEYLPDREAYACIIDELSKGVGGFDDRREQIAPIVALSRSDPNALLGITLRWLPTGYLKRSSRQQIASQLVYFAGFEQIEVPLLTRCAALLACDTDARTRDLVGQSMSFLSRNLAKQIFDEIPQVEGIWQQACAIRTLGYWDSLNQEIDRASNAAERELREAGDFARGIAKKRLRLSGLLQDFTKEMPTRRAATQLGLQNHGDDIAVWLLEKLDESSPAGLICWDVIDHILRRERKEYEEVGKEESRKIEKIGLIKYD